MTAFIRQSSIHSNAIHPKHLSTKERLGAVCKILALGIIRLRLRNTQVTADTGEIPLHFSLDQSGHVNRNGDHP